MNTKIKMAIAVGLFVATACGCQSLRSRSLLGSSKEDVLRTFGEPTQVSVSEHGYSTLQFTNSGLTAVFHDTNLVGYVFSRPSHLTVDSGIGIGTSLSDVVGRLGGYTNTQEVTEWFGGEAAGILYHHAGHNRFKLNYPDRGVSIMFGPDKKAETVWVKPRLTSK